MALLCFRVLRISFWRELGLAGAGRDRHGARLLPALPSHANAVRCGRAPVSLLCWDTGPKSAGSWAGGPKVLGCP